jgi:hypothetical protein
LEKTLGSLEGVYGAGAPIQEILLKGFMSKALLFYPKEVSLRSKGIPVGAGAP